MSNKLSLIRRANEEVEALRLGDRATFNSTADVVEEMVTRIEELTSTLLVVQHRIKMSQCDLNEALLVVSDLEMKEFD